MFEKNANFLNNNLNIQVMQWTRPGSPKSDKFHAQRSAGKVLHTIFEITEE